VQHPAAECIAPITGAFLISTSILLWPTHFCNASRFHVFHSQWWEDRTLMTYENIDFKGVHWAGWYDIFLQPMIETWSGYNFRSSAQNQQRLVIGPRGHCLTSFPLLFPDDRLADIWCALRV
jgi:predicted acyl esterase